MRIRRKGHAGGMAVLLCGLLCGLLGGLLWSGSARADIPSVQFLTQQDGDQVRLDLSYFYHGGDLPDCRTLIERQRNQDGNWITVFDGDLGEESMSCVCARWFTWEEGDPDAEGDTCAPDDGMVAVQGSCPVGHSCNCTRTCMSLYDNPCNATWSYRSEPLSYSHPAGTMLQGYAGLTVDFGDDCDSGDDSGGCATAGAAPHLYVMLLLLLGGLVPWWLRRRRRYGRQRS